MGWLWNIFATRRLATCNLFCSILDPPGVCALWPIVGERVTKYFYKGGAKYQVSASGATRQSQNYDAKASN